MEVRIKSVDVAGNEELKNEFYVQTKEEKSEMRDTMTNNIRCESDRQTAADTIELQTTEVKDKRGESHTQPKPCHTIYSGGGSKTDPCIQSSTVSGELEERTEGCSTSKFEDQEDAELANIVEGNVKTESHTAEKSMPQKLNRKGVSSEVVSQTTEDKVTILLVNYEYKKWFANDVVFTGRKCSMRGVERFQ